MSNRAGRKLRHAFKGVSVGEVCTGSVHRLGSSMAGYLLRQGWIVVEGLEYRFRGFSAKPVVERKQEWRVAA